MTWTQVRMAIAAVGVLIWGYGVRVDDATLRLVGMGFLLACLLLRFVPRRWRERKPETPAS